jgi:hypothetical protein
MDKKVLFHLLDLTTMNSFILFNSCGAKSSQRDFRLQLVRELTQEGGRVLLHQTTPWERLIFSTSRLKVQCSEQWPEKGNCM